MIWAEYLFYLLFLGQILLISYYFPKKLLQRMSYVRTNYPPDEYPKLYPKSPEVYAIGQWVFKYTNRLIMAVGFVVLFAVIFVVDHGNFADDGFVSEAWPAAYGLLQFLPFMVLEIMESGHLKLMRKLNSSTTRKAVLSPRRLLDFVSPQMLGAAVVLLLGALVFDFYVNDFVVKWDDTTQRSLVFVVTNLILAGVGANTLYRRKPDPHQAHEDRSRLILVSLNSLLLVSMALSVFHVSQAANDLWDLNPLDASRMTLYFQVIAWFSLGNAIRNLDVQNMDFAGYKGEVAEA